MRSSSPLARFVLIVSAVLVLAMVGVLYLALRPPLDDGGDAARAELDAATAADGSLSELPAPTDGGPTAAELPDPVEQPVSGLGLSAIVGRVVDDATSKPVTSFRVDVLPWEAGPALERLAAAHDRPERSKPVKSNAGVFRVERKSGRWDVIIRAPGYLPAVLADVVVPREDPRPTEIRLSRGPSLTGLVYDIDGRPVSDVAVFLHVTRLFDDSPPPETALSRTDGEGRFRFSPLPPGEYGITLLEADNAVDRLTGLTVQTGATDVSLPLQPRHQVVICVRDEAGTPLEGAQVDLQGAGTSASGRTSASGQAVLRHVLDGEYELSIARDGYATLTERLPLQNGFGNSVHQFYLARTTP